MGKNDKRLYEISSHLDWVEFLHLDQEENSVEWLINCNIKSPLYGWILAINQEQTFLIENIKILEMQFLELINNKENKRIYLK